MAMATIQAIDLNFWILKYLICWHSGPSEFNSEDLDRSMHERLMSSIAYWEMNVLDMW